MISPKIHQSLSALLLLSATAMADDSYRNRIVQIIENPSDANNPTYRYLNPIAASGSQNAPEGVNGTSVFQLWTVHETTGADYLLDEKTVSSYHPQATVTVTSQDPYEAVPRTRVDQPFNVKVNISGIVTNDPDVQDAAKSVIFDHQVIAYEQGETEAQEGAPSTTHDHDPITQNGDHEINGMTTLLSGSDLTQVRGEEVFSIYANPDFGVVGASLLATQRVQIWPVASGALSGVDETQKYAAVPTISIATTDLYPESDTYLRWYKTSDPSNANTSGIAGNYTPNTTVPVTRNWTIKNLNAQIDEDGVYTLELLHTTVFDTIRLGDPIQLTLDRSIEINGGVNTSE
ncbi:hypothetical protein JIN77_07435 [Verrucomicrobiaceae bacterium R5-34]|uniref:Uncharacterized protein n=1 Tax=Oceaniferula flava TaxID=2800421 RepID=A0AAE2SD16_9BACT|nr:hypothetical protein [Oceaniferula flavus]MBK1830553.1 hypothetical protein [Verrucomicrobiaceae bacterium R5-34]MBK1854649.1 hypothetical protein [Oceaniferula flavus]MBM1135955.1 hypothetical protein [Oceaniferula flavus]